MLRRIWALAVITCKEGIRNRSLFGVFAFALFVLGLNVAVAGFFMMELGKVTVDMNLSALTLSGLLLIFFIALHLMAKDIDKKTVQLVFSKPISRSEYIIGKYLGILGFVTASLLILVVFSVGTISVVSTMHAKYFSGFSWTMFFVAVFFVLVQLAVLTAMLVLFGTLTTSAFTCLIFTVCTYLVGVIIDDAMFFIRSSLGAGEVSESVKRMLTVVSHIIPNFSVWDFKLQAAHGLAVSFGQLSLAFAYGVIYIVVLLRVACLCFRRREFH